MPKIYLLRGTMMASRFRIFLHQNSDNLHLKLSGEFDGSSAYQLINAIKNHNGKAGNIYVHTGIQNDWDSHQEFLSMENRTDFFLTDKEWRII